MYVIEDETFQRARSILIALARELAAQEQAGIRRPVELLEIVRRSAGGDLPTDGALAFLRSTVDRLEKSFPIDELFPRRRRGGKTPV